MRNKKSNLFNAIRFAILAELSVTTVARLAVIMAVISPTRLSSRIFL